METKRKPSALALDLLVDVVGGALYAAGIYSFASPAEFAPGGISGLAILANHFLNIPIGVCTLLLNVPIVLLCIRTLGRSFFLRSLRTMVISTLLMDLVFPMFPVYTGDRLTAAIFAGALSGAGLALIYWRGSSTGGTDFLILSLRKKMPHLSIGNITIFIDGFIILMGGLVFGHIDAVLQGILMTAASTVVIDKITNRFITGEMALIVTGEGERIAEGIMSSVGRGVTALNGTGMYSGDGRTVLVCACNRAEATRIHVIASETDPNALVVLLPFDTAYGLGFQPHGV